MLIDLMQCCSISLQEVENTSGWHTKRVTVTKWIKIDGWQGIADKIVSLRGKCKPATNFILYAFPLLEINDEVIYWVSFGIDFGHCSLWFRVSVFAKMLRSSNHSKASMCCDGILFIL